MTRLLLVGWDAADWKVINPLIARGEMPNLACLTQSGVHGNHATLYLPLSPMLWTFIATGKRPTKHGIDGFTAHRGRAERSPCHQPRADDQGATFRRADRQPDGIQPLSLLSTDDPSDRPLGGISQGPCGAGANRGMYLGPPEFEGFEVVQTVGGELRIDATDLIATVSKKGREEITCVRSRAIVHCGTSLNGHPCLLWPHRVQARPQWEPSSIIMDLG